jgi:hypothetical protein
MLEQQWGTRGMGYKEGGRGIEDVIKELLEAIKVMGGGGGMASNPFNMQSDTPYNETDYKNRLAGGATDLPEFSKPNPSVNTGEYLRGYNGPSQEQMGPPNSIMNKPGQGDEQEFDDGGWISDPQGNKHRVAKYNPNDPANQRFAPTDQYAEDRARTMRNIQKAIQYGDTESLKGFVLALQGMGEESSRDYRTQFSQHMANRPGQATPQQMGNLQMAGGVAPTAWTTDMEVKNAAESRKDQSAIEMLKAQSRAYAANQGAAGRLGAEQLRASSGIAKQGYDVKLKRLNEMLLSAQKESERQIIKNEIERIENEMIKNGMTTYSNKPTYSDPQDDDPYSD